MKDLRQSSPYALYMEKIGWQEDKEENCQYYLRHLPLIGNFIKILRPQKTISPKIMEKIVKKHRAFAVQINYSPTKTLLLNLEPSLEKIFLQMKKEGRYEIRRAEKNNLVVKNSSDIEAFIKMWHQNAWTRGFWIPMKKEIRAIWEAFGENAYLILAYPLTTYYILHTTYKPIAGVLILTHDKTAYYFHAASTPEGRKLAAPSLTVWEAIKLGKNKGCQSFDFEGIYDERFPIKSWKGFSHFKKSFGGEEIEYPGSFVKYYNPLLKFIFRG